MRGRCAAVETQEVFNGKYKYRNHFDNMQLMLPEGRDTRYGFEHHGRYVYDNQPNE
ncbi:hypothetical protein KUL118_16360 [Tenacibaculum sp. KUL118]|nr:hypothetical protein KUL118_16360 [Tenacibaculum sp. KUL118]